MARRRARRATELNLAGYGGQRPEDRSSRSRTRGSPWRRRSTTIAATTCPHHVKAKGRDLDHKRDVDKERGLSERGFDYFHPCQRAGILSRFAMSFASFSPLRFTDPPLALAKRSLPDGFSVGELCRTA